MQQRTALLRRCTHAPTAGSRHLAAAMRCLCLQHCRQHALAHPPPCHSCCSAPHRPSPHLVSGGRSRRSGATAARRRLPSQHPGGGRAGGAPAAAAAAANRSTEPLAEGVDFTDPELQAQIDAMLRELDPELLLDDTGELLTVADLAAAAAATQQQQQQPSSGSSGQQLGGAAASAAAWQDEEGDEETESGLPDGVVLSRADYKRKAAILLELLAAQRGEGEAAAEAFVQRLAAFAVDLDEALLHMVDKRLQAAQQHGEDAVMVQQLQDLQAVLRLEYERSQATPAMRLLDEVMDMLGDDPTLPGARQRTEAVISRLKSAFTGGASESLDVFAAAAALAEDRALAADVLSVEYVPQMTFLAEGSQLLDQAREEMNALSAAVTSAQAELQQVRNAQPELLNSPQAQERVQQLEAADAVLQQRRTALAQLAFCIEVAGDLDAAAARVASPASAQEDAAAALMQDPERLAQLLGITGSAEDGE